MVNVGRGEGERRGCECTADDGCGGTSEPGSRLMLLKFFSFRKSQSFTTESLADVAR